MSLTQEDIKKVAKLARIKIEPERYPEIQNQMNSIFDWIDQLQKVDVSSLDIEVHETKPMMDEREDLVTAEDQLQDVLKNAPSCQHNMFAVPKVVE